jgi:hypothetical protein
LHAKIFARQNICAPNYLRAKIFARQNIWAPKSVQVIAIFPTSQLIQGILTEVEGSVRLTSLKQLAAFNTV